MEKAYWYWVSGGRFITSCRFNAPGIHVAGAPGNTVSENYFCENDLALTGFVMLKGKDNAEAAAIAKSFPALDIGGNVEIREVQTNTN